MSSNQSINKTPNSRFLLFSHRCTQTLGFKCLSISQSRWTRINPSDMKHWPGFPQQKAKKQKKSTFSANAFDSTKPRILISFNTLTHPSPIFIILQNVVRFTSNEWYYNKKQQVIKKNNLEFLPNFVKVKDTKSKKKIIHETTKISISPPNFFFSDRPPNQSRPQNNIIKIVAFVWKNSDFEFTKIRILKKKSL